MDYRPGSGKPGGRRAAAQTSGRPAPGRLVRASRQT